VLVEWRGKSLLVDTPPELRLQLVRSHVRRVDAILFTHSHADHLLGLDDVRRFNDLQGGELPVLARADVLDDVQRTFSYIFRETQAGGGKPRLSLTPIEGDRFTFDGVPIDAVPILHGQLAITAYRFGSFAYATDASAIPPASMERLRGLDTLVLGALRDEWHPTHFTIAQSLAAAADLAPRRTFFVHMAHSLPHGATQARLPANVQLAYDGLAIEIPE
jgi:phosphoribosyl 1,2-cyclic phosphate phosphodiesterase